MLELFKDVPKAAVKIIIIAFVIFIIAVTQEFGHVMKESSGAGQTQLSESQPLEKTYHKVLKVTDGDTIRVDIDGKSESVRLIGINTPETVDPRRSIECFGKEASNRMKEIVGGEDVYLETDISQGTRDAYGRLLAYVYLRDGQMANRKMVAEGYAYEYTYMAPYKYQREFRELQNLAKASKYGLWSDDTCAGTK